VTSVFQDFICKAETLENFKCAWLQAICLSGFEQAWLCVEAGKRLNAVTG
jgi:hypothetical protein